MDEDYSEQYAFADLKETELNEAIAKDDKTRLKALAPELNSRGFYFLLGKCLHAVGDSNLIKEFYRKNPQVDLLEAFFFLKRDLPFNSTPNWAIGAGTKFEKKYRAWIKSKGCEVRNLGPAYIPRVVSGIESFIRISGNEKAAVAIANSGLYGGFLARGLGVETFVVDSHRKNKGATYREIDDFNITGKEVLVIDNDLVSGRTMKRVLCELKKKKPKSMSALFYHTPNYDDIFSDLGNLVPRVYCSDRFQDSPNTLDLIDKIETGN